MPDNGQPSNAQVLGRTTEGDMFCTAADVPAEAVGWLWKDRFALGKIALVAGAPSVGKSLLVAGDFAGRVSAGTPWPDGTACPAGDVLIASRQEGSADTLVPRLKEHGADLRRVHFVGGAVYDNDADPEFRELGVLGALDQGLRRRPGVKLVVIDPVADLLESRRPGRCTDMLDELRRMARHSGAAIILVADCKEARADRPLAGIAPAALVSAARSVWALSRDPQDWGRRFFLPAKNSLAECAGHALRVAGGKVQWEAKPVPAGGEAFIRGWARRLAAAFIADFLKDGPRMWLVVAHHAKLAGHNRSALERARAQVAEPIKARGQGGRWLWRLIGDDRDSSVGDIADLFSGDPVGRRASGNAVDRPTGPFGDLRFKFEPDDAEDELDDADDEDDDEDGDEGDEGDEGDGEGGAA